MLELYIKVCKFQLDKNLSSRQDEVKEKAKIEDEEKLETSELPGMYQLQQFNILGLTKYNCFGLDFFNVV